MGRTTARGRSCAPRELGVDAVRRAQLREHLAERRVQLRPVLTRRERLGRDATLGDGEPDRRMAMSLRGQPARAGKLLALERLMAGELRGIEVGADASFVGARDRQRLGETGAVARDVARRLIGSPRTRRTRRAERARTMWLAVGEQPEALRAVRHAPPWIAGQHDHAPAYDRPAPRVIGRRTCRYVPAAVAIANAFLSA